MTSKSGALAGTIWPARAETLRISPACGARIGIGAAVPDAASPTTLFKRSRTSLGRVQCLVGHADLRLGFIHHLLAASATGEHFLRRA